MQTNKREYLAPLCEVWALRCEGVIAASGDPVFTGLGAEDQW